MDTGVEKPPPLSGWRLPRTTLSLPEVHGTVPVPHGAGFWRKLFAFAAKTGETLCVVSTAPARMRDVSAGEPRRPAGLRGRKATPRT